jgi:hypothetical protein
MSSVGTYIYNRTNSVLFLADNMRNALRDVIRETGLSPQFLMDQWDSWVHKAIRTWAESGHLRAIVIEFYKPNATTASARWDFPVGYTGSGLDDDMWLDKAHLRQLIAKAAKPSSDCVYRVLLTHAPNPPAVPGMNLSDIPFLSTGQLSARSAGTLVATPHLTASATYWG